MATLSSQDFQQGLRGAAGVEILESGEGLWASH